MLKITRNEPESISANHGVVNFKRMSVKDEIIVYPEVKGDPPFDKKDWWVVPDHASVFPKHQRPALPSVEESDATASDQSRGEETEGSPLNAQVACPSPSTVKGKGKALYKDFYPKDLWYCDGLFTIRLHVLPRDIRFEPWDVDDCPFKLADFTNRRLSYVHVEQDQSSTSI